MTVTKAELERHLSTVTRAYISEVPGRGIVHMVRCELDPNWLRGRVAYYREAEGDYLLEEEHGLARPT